MVVVVVVVVGRGVSVGVGGVGIGGGGGGVLILMLAMVVVVVVAARVCVFGLVLRSSARGTGRWRVVLGGCLPYPSKPAPPFPSTIYLKSVRDQF